ncbi:MAG TPA: DUF6265 family protein [Flavobacterium sp.]|jgi:hypothetical protein|nr:DUF6265 family protein [Flavobacterium sp.]
MLQSVKNSFIVLPLTLILLACNDSKSSKNIPLKSSEWLIGNWESKTENGTLIESWEKLNDSTFQGYAYYIINNDTLHNEQIVLEQIGDSLIYNTKVSGQNRDQSIPFKSTLLSKNRLVFENKNHDYPQKIVYNKIKNDSLMIEVSGNQKGKMSVDKFNMKKVK